MCSVRFETDGEHGYSIDTGEIGEIRYIVPSTENESDENKGKNIVYNGYRYI